MEVGVQVRAEQTSLSHRIFSYSLIDKTQKCFYRFCAWVCESKCMTLSALESIPAPSFFVKETSLFSFTVEVS
jgi:hypothetical protein